MMDFFTKYFSVQVFFLIFRETLETAIIVSVLLTFLKRGLSGASLKPSRSRSGFQRLDHSDDDHNLEVVSHDSATVGSATASSGHDANTNNNTNNNNTNEEQDAASSSADTALLGSDGDFRAVESKMYSRLVTQVWVGATLGLIICLLIGGLFIFLFYMLGTNLWNVTEKVWEAVFSIVASLIITVMGMAMLRINKMKEKWRVKLARIIISTHEGTAGWGLRHLGRKYALAILPLVTTLREGLEAVVFLGGMGVSQPTSSFPLSVVCAVALGSLVGWCMYRYGNSVSLQYFMIGSTCFLYLVAAGLLSRGVWFAELQQFITKVGQDVSELGSGPGSYDITRSVWHVNCCNSQTDGPWMLFNALLGWQNSATYGSVISYNLYWWVIIVSVLVMKYRETHNGRLPLIPDSWQPKRKHRYALANESLMDRATLIYTSNNANGREAAASRPSHESLNSTSPLVN